MRFCNLFIDELQLGDHPCYPAVGWFRALVRADAEFKDLGPQLSLKPQLYGSEAIRVTGIRESGPGVEADFGPAVAAAFVGTFPDPH